MSLPTTVLFAAICGLAPGAPAAPPPPATYDVVVRYRIVAFPNERVAQFNAMMKDLAARGFRRDPADEPVVNEPSDTTATRLRGSIAAAKVRSLLLDRHVRELLLIPSGEKLPDDANRPVRVTIELTTGLPPDRQQLLHTQTAVVLDSLKFSESVGYDHRDFTRLVGSIPAGQVGALLSDLRETPAGQTQPAPFANMPAIRIAEVRPDLPAPSPRPAPPAIPAVHEKIAAELRELVADAARATKPARMEILLAREPEARDQTWERPLRLTAPDIAIEGRFGTVVTAIARPDQAPALAALPEVVGLRLPRRARSVAASDTAELAKQVGSDLESLHTRGYRGKGSRVAIVAADFRGWEGLVGKALPKSSRLIDLTRERNENLQPDPYPAGAGPGEGTVLAQMTAKSVPDADLVLIRVDPSTPYMLQSIVRAAVGEPTGSLALEQRERQLTDERTRLDVRRAELLEQRRQVFSDLREEGEALRQREDYLKKQAAFDLEERAYQALLGRYIDHQKALLQLKGLRLVASPLEAASANMQRQSRESCGPLWIQPVGRGPEETWSGLFRDSDRNGVMEFAPTETPLPTDNWSRELNFLAWRDATGKVTPDLPAGSRVRVTLQWREPHDASLARIGQDHFREPLAAVRLQVVRQSEPAGSKRPADDLEIVAQSAGVPHRLDQTPSSASYEVSVEWRVPEAGRYAIRVEGRMPESDRPLSLPTLPRLRRTGEIRPRIVADTLEGDGRAIWRDFHGETEPVGKHADSR
jgi:hypothetical protein